VINTKLIQILKSFSADEFKEFGKFVASPYLNSNRKIDQLYDIFRKYYPKFKSYSLKPEAIAEKLYPGRKYNPGYLHNLYSEMISLAEDFLVYSDFRRDSSEYDKRLLNQYSIRNLDKFFEKYLERAFKLLEQEKVKDESYYLKRNILENIKFEFYSSRTPIGKSQPLFIQKKNAVINFMYHFFITMLKEYFDMSNTEGLIKFEYRYFFFDEIMDHISRHKKEYKEILLIDILHRFLLLYRNPQEEPFEEELETLVNTNKTYLSKNDYRNFMLELYNYYKQKRAEGNKSYGMKSFKLLNDMLSDGIFYMKDGQMSAHTYINLISAGLLEKELIWAENFIHEYKNRIPPDQRNNAFLYSYADLNFVKGRENPGQRSKFYNIALNCLAKVKSEDFFYMTRIKNILLRIYYDLDDIEPALSIIDSYKHFLSKTKQIPEDLYEQYYNFIGFTGKLIKIKTKTETMALDELKEEISSTKLLSFRGWLLEKISEMEPTPNNKNGYHINSN
jgi:hypothetical protein